MWRFIDRKEETRALRERLASGKAEFMVVYGKRRVGKTELIKQSFKGQGLVYLLADKRNDNDLLRDFSRQVGEYFGDVGISLSGIPDWTGLFRYLGSKVKKERCVLVVDEFPYLVSANKAIPSLFQKGWDEHLQASRIYLVLMGSSISMMERGVLAYRSPLYGRRTGQILLHPLRFASTREFFPKKTLRVHIETFSVLGGMPAYLLQFSQNKSILGNIRDNVLKKDAFLYNEVEFVLKGELREPRNYFSILKEMAFGRTTVNEISQAVGLERNVLSRYLSTLERLRIIVKDIPATTRHPHKSRRGVYRIDDNFFRFWFEFVLPNKGLIERGDEKIVLDKIGKDMNRFVARTFEDVCREAVALLAKGGALFPLRNLGRWWEGGEEIDIVGLNEETKDILFAECKWQNEKTGTDVAANLLRKAELVDWNRSNRKMHFLIFSRSGFKSSCSSFCRENGIETYDLAGLEKVFPRVR